MKVIIELSEIKIENHNDPEYVILDINLHHHPSGRVIANIDDLKLALRKMTAK